jgi:hypothetical protein
VCACCCICVLREGESWKYALNTDSAKRASRRGEGCQDCAVDKNSIFTYIHTM